jgi:hypothetical protein
VKFDRSTSVKRESRAHLSPGFPLFSNRFVVTRIGAGSAIEWSPSGIGNLRTSSAVLGIRFFFTSGFVLVAEFPQLAM